MSENAAIIVTKLLYPQFIQTLSLVWTYPVLRLTLPLYQLIFELSSLKTNFDLAMPTVWPDFILG